MAFYEYVGRKFGETDGTALNLFPDLAWTVAFLSAAAFVVTGPFAARRLLAGE